MKLYAPEYYKEFKCIADRCRHSCCVGWEIDIDGDTLEKYSSLEGGYGEKIAKSIEGDETPHFRLSYNDRCPHLDEDGLCSIIKELGEGYLCHICREHPRFYNDTKNGREVGLGLSCEEAARIILSSDGYATLETVGEVKGETVGGFDPLPYRERIYSILSDRTVPYAKRLERIGGEFGASLEVLSDDEWRELLWSLEYLEEGHKQRFRLFSSSTKTPEGFEKELERALAYFVYRHVTAAEDENELSAALGLCLLSERLLCSIARDAEGFDDFCDLARIVSEEIEYSTDNTEAIKLEFWF